MSRTIDLPAPAAPAESPQAPDTHETLAPDAATELDAGQRQRLISEAAYDLYVARGYQDGFDVDDWLSAEQMVDRHLTRTGTT